MNLSSQEQKIIEFIVTAITSGIIGNRADVWLQNLYNHEKIRFIKWIKNWTLTDEDQKLLNQNENYKILFSQITKNVTNEIYDEKLIIWSMLTLSFLRDEKYDFDKKQFFINLFTRIDKASLYFLSELTIKKKIDYYIIFPHNELKKPSIKANNFSLYLGYLLIHDSGLIDMISKDNTVYFRLSELGNEFLDFITYSTKEHIKNIQKKNEK